ncbi:MAG: response regulator, partial [bacterium]
MWNRSGAINIRAPTGPNSKIFSTSRRRSRIFECGEPHYGAGTFELSSGAMSILIAEDNVAQRHYLREILQKE